MAFGSILWQEYILFKRKFWTITSSAMIGPVLYLIVFGWGIGSQMNTEGGSYLSFVIPGIIALTTMNTSFNNIGNSINISRIYDKTFEAYMVAPIKTTTYAFGKILGSALRGMYSGLIIILLSLLFSSDLHYNAYFILIMFLNCLVFAAIGFTAGILIKSHSDMNRFSTFVITPMTFLCGTFFSLDKMPIIIKELIYILPLSHTSSALRGISLSTGFDLLNIFVLLLYFVVILAIGVHFCKVAE